ncbi:hypothetical protein EON67_06850, partial [archaeon]
MCARCCRCGRSRVCENKSLACFKIRTRSACSATHVIAMVASFTVSRKARVVGGACHALLPPTTRSMRVCGTTTRHVFCTQRGDAHAFLRAGADVYDRVSSFFDTLFRSFRRGPCNKHTNVIIVTHGLTLRLFLTRYFHWPVELFERTTNPNNAAFVVMERCRDRPRSMR